MNLTIEQLTPEQLRPMPKNFSFGKTFSNRMFTQVWDKENGWHDAKIGPYKPFVLDPSTSVFHYAQEIFEGTKAYRRPDGHINLFRVMENAKRFNRSASRMVMQEVDPEDHVEAIVELVRLEKDWIPNVDGASLYIRPAMIGTEAALGVHAASSYLHFIIVGPVGAYFATGFAPAPVYISDDYVRSVRGGVGDAKTGGNYAASLYVSEQVKELGYQQVLWLDAVERKYVEEVGSMNIAFVYNGNHIVTPELSGSILPGITRDSLIHMAPDLGYKMTQGKLSISDILRDIRSGEITEAFGMGTAAVIAPVNKFGFKKEEYIVGNGDAGPVANHLFKALTDIQYGRVADPYGWTLKIEV